MHDDDRSHAVFHRNFLTVRELFEKINVLLFIVFGLQVPVPRILNPDALLQSPYATVCGLVRAPGPAGGLCTEDTVTSV